MNLFNLKHKNRNFFTSCILLLSCSSLYAENSTRSWQTIIPEGGMPLSSFASSPSNPHIIYAFSGGILYNSQDGGMTWIKVEAQGKPDFTTLIHLTSLSGFSSIPNSRGVDSILRVDSLDPQTLFAIKDQVLSKSTDGGISWHKISQDLTINAGKFFLLNPPPMTQSLKGLVFTNNKDSQDGQHLAISHDGGDHWALSESPVQQIENQPVTIEGIDRENSQIIYSTVLDLDPNSPLSQALYKSTDGGLNWINILPSFSHNYIGNLKLHPLDSNILFAKFKFPTETIPGSFTPGSTVLGVYIPDITIPETTISESGYMRSTDGGESWERLTSPDKESEISPLTFDSTDINRLYADLLPLSKGGIGFGGNFERRIAKSNDSGKSWQIYNLGLTNASYTQPTQGVEVNNPFLLYQSNRGALVSHDGGENWFDSHTNTRNLLNGNLAVAEDNVNVMYFVTDTPRYSSSGSLLFKSHDGGEHWEKNLAPLDFKGRFCQKVIINPKDSASILCKVSTVTERIYKSTDSGNNWKISKISSDDFNSGQISYAYDGKTIYYLQGNILSKSIDNGDNWKDLTITPTQLTFRNSDYGNQSSLLDDDFRKILVDPRNADIVYAAGFLEDSKAGVYKSIDGGNNWALLFDVTSPNLYFRLLMHPLNPDRLLLLNNDSEKSMDAFITDDGGNNWRKLIFSSPSIISYFTFDMFIFNPKNPDGLFYSATDGTYESKNLGVSWNLASKGYNKGLKTAYDTVYTSYKILLSPKATVEHKDCLFEWAEQQYPTFFSAALAETQLTNDYSYRYYNDTNTYLGVFQGEKIHLLQANLTDEIKDVGYFEYFQHLAGCD